MKRKETAAPKDQLTLWQKEKEVPLETPSAEEETAEAAQTVFYFDEGKLRPFLKDQYTATTLFQLTESFAVECKLVKPEDPGNIIFDGKKPSKRTVPILITRSGDSRLLESWESLESDPRLLAEAAEVIGVTAVKQVFVLKRKDG